MKTTVRNVRRNDDSSVDVEVEHGRGMFAAVLVVHFPADQIRELASVLAKALGEASIHRVTPGQKP